MSSKSSQSGNVRDTITIAVIGVSGTERVKGAIGVGKSLLCNRFIRGDYDSFQMEHSSILSQADFSGSPVVNNDHWLYWGEALLNSDDLYATASVRLIEQTEFVDDETFEALAGAGEEYSKRATRTRLESADKLMYICKEQLGLEAEFAHQTLPEGRCCVDGFVYVYDISAVDGRPFQMQSDFALVTLQTALKTKKPVMIAASKADIADESGRKALQRLLSRKELKSANIPMEQLGLEAEFAHQTLPEGRCCVDGFVYVYDISAVDGRPFQMQSDFALVTLQTALKTKKPVMIAASKADIADESGRKALQRLLSRKELKSANIPMVEVSAFANVNVTSLFALMTALIEKWKVKPKMCSFGDALSQQRKHEREICERYVAVLRELMPIESWPQRRPTWAKLLNRIGLARHLAYTHFVYVFGRAEAKKLYQKHVNEAREFWMQRSERYVAVLRELMPIESWPQRRPTWAKLLNRIGLARHLAYTHFVYVFGRAEAKKLYQKHVNEAREFWMQRRLQTQTPRLTHVFADLIGAERVRTMKWADAKEAICSHPLFDEYFQPLGTLAADLDPSSPQAESFGSFKICDQPVI
ncbi:Rho GTPase-activating protein [Toxocara canis]|uniref:Rho GTPase-activating protein n=1 Tax=Toxocara canis TaxID=6265 RepID=A0A0B2W619_TOXCA|nr:Rho GTPase-activating protein [Toxocara canis]